MVQTAKKEFTGQSLHSKNVQRVYFAAKYTPPLKVESYAKNVVIEVWGYGDTTWNNIIKACTAVNSQQNHCEDIENGMLMIIN